MDGSDCAGKGYRRCNVIHDAIALAIIAFPTVGCFKTVAPYLGHNIGFSKRIFYSIRNHQMLGKLKIVYTIDINLIGSRNNVIIHTVILEVIINAPTCCRRKI